MALAKGKFSYGRLKGKGIISDREIRFKCIFQNTILDVLRARPGWQEVQGDGEWDLYWCDREWLHANYDNMFLQEHQKILHFRNHYELTRKNLMVKNLKRFRKQTDKELGKADQGWDFFPATFELPSEYHIFVEEFKRNPGMIWIMKPAAKSQGRGIFLFRKLKDITDWKKGEYQPLADPNVPKDIPETYVVQRYIDNPYLIGGRKFDIRIYVLVLSFNPMKVWLYRGGFARFSNSRFSLDSLEDTYIHLTNVAVQKTSPDYDPEKGCKWSAQQLRKYLVARHGFNKVKNMFTAVDNIIIKSLHSVQKVIINDKHCFEMYGYDILLDDTLKPWLIEINASPSLTASGQEDYDLKFGLLNDVLNVLDLENRLSGKEKRIGGWDLLWDDGPVVIDEMSQETGLTSYLRVNSFLGCQNTRKEQLRETYSLAEAFKSAASTHS
ncbi:probable tubulin polyglutamylase TTLL9 [Physella acuta]|uniref:probable tubulin polyglutamylase TTLL9 n=1 Tax=Physella acuta TaxID=109671 RepID=UPI0027DB4D1F|nr:probable tubulin polyglutamylase TTLL9 [Physella acuta]XP_059153431.1 probable tubulin polyglutamylase TTLL9 [Physella acuta]XP_059153432.1 probable tubulin polyglutamylase TTLL9 [Physella acuta]